MLLQPTLYIFFAALSLAQFQILYSAVLHYLHLLSKSEYTSGFAIYFATITGNLKGVLGELSLPSPRTRSSNRRRPSHPDMSGLPFLAPAVH